MTNLKSANVYCRVCNKHYYACKYCLRTESWRSFCCSEECHVKYVQAVLNEREKTKISSAKNDLSSEELNELKQLTPEQAMEQTQEDLKDYIDENPNSSLSEILEMVNKDIDEQEPQDKKIKKKK